MSFENSNRQPYVSGGRDFSNSSTRRAVGRKTAAFRPKVVRTRSGNEVEVMVLRIKDGRNTYVVSMSSDAKVYQTKNGPRMYATVKKYVN